MLLPYKKCVIEKRTYVNKGATFFSDHTLITLAHKDT